MQQSKTPTSFLLGSILFAANNSYAEHALRFKKELVSDIHWFPYLLVLSILFIALFYLAKKTKIYTKPHAHCKIIEKIPVHHKTKIYIIDYQGQRFMIADNQSALAIHQLQEVKQSA